MKTTNFISFCSIAFCALIGFSSCNKPLVVTPDAVPVQLDREETWSLMTLDGEIIAENEFETVPSAVYNGRFVVENDSIGCWIYDIDNPTKEINDEAFTQLTSFITGYAYGTREDSGILVVDRDGNVVKELPDDIATINISSFGNNDMIIYSDINQKYGYLTPKGDIAINAQWENCREFNEGKALVKDENNRWICINESGKELFKLDKNDSPVGAFINGWLAVEDNEKDRFRFVDTNGETIVKLKAKQFANPFIANDRVIIKDYEDDEYILMKDLDVDKGEKIKTFDKIYPIGLDGKRYASRKSSDSDWIIIDENGEKVCNSRFERLDDNLTAFGLILASEDKDSPYSLYSNNGEAINYKIELKDARLPIRSWIKSPKAYNKRMVDQVIEVIGSADKFGGKYNIPNISATSKAEEIYTNLGFESAQKAYYKTYGYNPYYIEQNSDITINEYSKCDFCVIFNKTPITSGYYGWSRYFNFADVNPIACGVEIYLDNDEKAATMTAFVNELKAKGWKQSPEQQYAFEGANDQYVYIIPTRDGILAIHAFAKLDAEKLFKNSEDYSSDYIIKVSLSANKATAEVEGSEVGAG